MTIEQENLQQDIADNTVCEACGCAGEIGYLIKEGDHVADVFIEGLDKVALDGLLNQYKIMALDVNPKVEETIVSQDSNKTHVQYSFEVSAEKLIFELKTRALNR